MYLPPKKVVCVKLSMSVCLESATVQSPEITMRAKSKIRKYDKSTAMCRECGTCGDLKAVSPTHTDRLRSLDDLLAADMFC